MSSSYSLVSASPVSVSPTGALASAISLTPLDFESVIQSGDSNVRSSIIRSASVRSSSVRSDVPSARQAEIHPVIRFPENPRAALLQRPSLLERFAAVQTLSGVTSAARLEVRPAPEMVASGVAAIDAFAGGLPRGCLSEVFGAASSGRTSVLLAALAAATRRQEACALVDVSDVFDPVSAAEAGVDFEKLLWVRCGQGKAAVRGNSSFRNANSDFQNRNSGFQNKDRTGRSSGEGPVEQALRVTDLLLQSGGFGMVAIDLGDVPHKFARRIPLTSWFRFQRAVEHTPTVLFVVAENPCAQTCATLLLKVQKYAGEKYERHQYEHRQYEYSEQTRAASPAHAQLMEGFEVQVELLRARMQRKPVASVTSFRSHAAWAG
ncbi:MAG: hypothetical protein ABJA69_10285 [Acidobacteriaceae bacterium]